MGFDPASLMAYAAIASAAAGVGSAAYTMTRPSPKAPPKPGAPPTPVEGGPETGKKRKAYRPAAQLFKDEDLRLGAAGKLGL